MKKLTAICLFLAAGCFASRPKTATENGSITRSDSTLYRVFKIDSVNSYYLIYAKKAGSTFKIVSSKTIKSGCAEMKVKGEYQFMLRSYLSRQTPFSSNLHISGFSFDDSTFIYLERDSINDLFIPLNFSGLCEPRKY